MYNVYHANISQATFTHTGAGVEYKIIKQTLSRIYSYIPVRSLADWLWEMQPALNMTIYCQFRCRNDLQFIDFNIFFYRLVYPTNYYLMNCVLYQNFDINYYSISYRYWSQRSLFLLLLYSYICKNYLPNILKLTIFNKLKKDKPNIVFSFYLFGTSF